MIRTGARIVKNLKSEVQPVPSFKSVQIFLIAAIVVSAMAVHAGTRMGVEYKGYEVPPYEVEYTAGDREVRRYAPYIVAEVTVAGDRSQAIRAGFRVLANYIFGGNAENQKVEMTVPVTQEPAGGNWTVQFMMPASYTLDTLPRPETDAIRFFEARPERQVTISFSGRGTTRMLQSKTRELRAFAREQGLTVAGNPRYHFYDDPFTLPWNRRNEVSLPVM